jgi:CheY-like chemotaxis protein
MDATQPAHPVVVVVDDDATFLQTAATILVAHGFDIRAAADAEEGWRLVLALEPAAILCDINMPGTDGVDLYRRLRKHPRAHRVPFVFLSGLFTPAEAAERTVSAPAGTSYLPKPVKIGELVDHLRREIAAAAAIAPAVHQDPAT